MWLPRIIVGNLKLDVENGMITHFDYKIIETDDSIDEDVEVKDLVEKSLQSFAE